MDKHGRIDALVNNSGIMPIAPIAALEVEEWDRRGHHPAHGAGFLTWRARPATRRSRKERNAASNGARGRISGDARCAFSACLLGPDACRAAAWRWWFPGCSCDFSCRPKPKQRNVRWRSLVFSTGDVDGKMATASRPGLSGKTEIEAADDFNLGTPTVINSATFTGLVTGNGSTVGTIDVEIYRVFPNDSDVGRTSGTPTFSTPNVPTRVNSPSRRGLSCP
jgi:NAD(P)-dependent dehydrogenase (short-subunit alcohol dehydrogenase family)